jgi:hypothetical protein
MLTESMLLTLLLPTAPGCTNQVRCLTTAISVNVWVPHPSDPTARVEEAIVKVVLAALHTRGGEPRPGNRGSREGDIGDICVCDRPASVDLFCALLWRSDGLIAAVSAFAILTMQGLAGREAAMGMQ